MAVNDDSHALDYYTDEETGDGLTDSLMLIDKARAALAQAENLADIGAVREIAERARRYAVAARLGTEAENHAALLRIDAERKAGELLAETEKHDGGRPSGNRSQFGTGFPARLAELGVTKRQSSDWQRMAKIPETVFRQHVEQVTKSKKPLRKDGVMQIARRIEREVRAAQPKPTPEPSSIPARIEIADALVMPLERDSIDLIVTSPPYALDVEYDGADVHPSAWQAFIQKFCMEALRVTKPSGRLALNVPLDTTRGYLRPTYADAVGCAQRAGWIYRSTVVWHDGQTTKGGWALGSQASAARPHHVSQVEMIALFSKVEWAPSSHNPDDITPEQFLEAGRGPWAFPGESHAWEDHPAAFPIELPRRLIRYLCRVGDVVLDPFCGSGTTPLAAMQLGRQAIGFDRSQQYVDSTLRRLAAHGKGSAGLGAAGARSGLSGTREETGEPGGLRRRLDSGAGGAPEQECIPAGAAGVAV